MKKFYLTVAYPYPNSPQHIGHGRTYSLTDAYARFKRMQGYRVLFPMAFHYTGTPILAMAKRLREGDPELIYLFSKVYGIPEDVLRELRDPLKMARYFHEEIKRGMRLMGYSIDWRREFTTIDQAYNRFITWQFHKLHERGYLTKGRHPVGWCPRCDNAVGQHDTKGDVEPEIAEVTLIKFEGDSIVLPTATYRPETVFGVTNIWVNPDLEYVIAEVGGERWVVSEEALLKLRFQGFDAREVSRIRGSELIGKHFRNPATGGYIPVLPANFVRADYGSGVVMSVPGHAPYDFLALRDLRLKPEVLETYGLDSGLIQGIEPISIIEVEGFSEIPAKDAVESLGVSHQLDPKAEEATQLVYSREYHTGRMKDNTGIYAGLPVREAKEKVKEDLIRDGKAHVFFEIANSPVYCRCGAKVLVKVVASGVCHSDLSIQRGILPMPPPIIIGHEGAGIVEAVGPGVSSVQPGDHVILTWLYSCGRCRDCARGKPHLCETAAMATMSGAMYDGTTRFRVNGEDMRHWCGSFADHTVVPEQAVVPIRKDVPLESACLVGCGVMTGVGAAMNTAKVEPGDQVAVVGCGGVGLNVIQGA
ncbi:MAG: class I tRNA ligase family protein, partial [Candidatus Korarchaeum sp.]